MLACSPGRAADPARGGRGVERVDHRLGAPRPIPDEIAIRLCLFRAAHRLDGRAGAVEVGANRDPAARGARDRMEPPRVTVEIAQAVALELQLRRDTGPADHHVQAGPAVDAV